MNVFDIKRGNALPEPSGRAEDAVSIETVPMPNINRPEGRYFGVEGVICEALFSLLTALYAGRSSAPTRTAKLCTLIGLLAIYTVVRIAYEPRELRSGMLEVLASVSRDFKQYSHAIRCGEYGLKYAYVPHATKMLLIAGLMRAHDALYAADMPGSLAHHYFCELRERFEVDEYDPLEVKIRILRALAWFTEKYSAREYIDAKKYVGDAMTLAVLLHDEEQVGAIKGEFTQLLSSGSCMGPIQPKGDM